MLRERTHNDHQADDHTHWLAPVSTIGALAVGSALQLAEGTLDPAAIALVGLTFFLLVGAALTRRPSRFSLYDARLVPILCGLGLVLQIAQLNGTAPGRELRLDPSFTLLFTWGLAGLAIAGGALIAGVRRVPAALLVAAMVIVHFTIGAEVISRSQGTFIDVAVFQRQAADALRHGVNPYTITFPNIYGDDRFYGVGASIGGRLQFGYPYFPLSLLVALPGEVLAGDHRFAALVAIELAAILMAYARRDGFGTLAAVLFLTTPRTFFVLEQSWTEPFVVLGMAAVVFAACRHSRLLPWLFGLFVALKQYLVFALPAVLLLFPSPIDRRALARFVVKAALIGAVVTLPFVLWNPSAFISSVVTLQFHQPFRPESLSFLSWWAQRGHAQPSAVHAFIVASVVSGLAIAKLPRTPSGFSGALALTFLGFFAFNKQAFANYYFFVIGALCLTLATSVRVAATKAANVDAAAPVLSSRRWSQRLAAAALVAASLVPLVWPGDAPFINDEPLLITAALNANASGTLAERGLMGTFSFAYGPFPTWVYQALLTLSKDMIVIAVVHTILIAATTAFALWWLSRSLGLWAWFAPVPLLSPYFWFYARVLWDNPFLIPLGALAVAGYAAHLSSKSRAGLPVSMAAAAAMPLVHLMSVAFVVPLGVHMLLFQWRALWARRGAVLAILAAVGLAAWPYWRYLTAAQTPAPGGSSGLPGWLFPLMGGRLLSARELLYFYGRGPIDGGLMRAAAGTSWIAYGLVWAGLAVATGLIVLAVRGRRWTARAQIAAILLGTLACQMALDGFAGKFEHPQYYNATWITFTLLAWFAADWLVSAGRGLRWTAIAASALLALSLFATVSTLAVRLHRTSGTREIYGPTLQNQQDVARSMAQYSPSSPVTTNVVPFQLYPHALATLRQLTARKYQVGPYRDLEVRYASPDPASGAIEVVAR